MPRTSTLELAAGAGRVPRVAVLPSYSDDFDPAAERPPRAIPHRHTKQETSGLVFHVGSEGANEFRIEVEAVR